MRESECDGVVERLERVRNGDDVGDGRTAEQRGVHRVEDEHVDFVAACGEVGEERRRLNDIAEASELDNEGACHEWARCTGVTSASERNRPVERDFWHGFAKDSLLRGIPPMFFRECGSG